MNSWSSKYFKEKNPNQDYKIDELTGTEKAKVVKTWTEIYSWFWTVIS